MPEFNSFMLPAPISRSLKSCHSAILQGTDHLQSGTVADIAQQFKGVAAEGSLSREA
jgi:hypothetical protein